MLLHNSRIDFSDRKSENFLILPTFLVQQRHYTTGRIADMCCAFLKKSIRITLGFL